MIHYNKYSMDTERFHHKSFLTNRLDAFYIHKWLWAKSGLLSFLYPHFLSPRDIHHGSLDMTSGTLVFLCAFSWWMSPLTIQQMHFVPSFWPTSIRALSQAWGSLSALLCIGIQSWILSLAIGFPWTGFWSSKYSDLKITFSSKSILKLVNLK